MALIGFDGGVHIGTVNLDVTLGGELHPGSGAAVTGKFHPDPDDPFVVTKQSLRLLVHESLEGRGELEMNAGDDDFVVVLAVHDAAFGFVCAAAGRGPESQKITLSPMSLLAPTLPDLAAAVVTGGSSGLGEAFICLLRSLRPAVPVCNLSRRPYAEKTGATFQPPPHHVACDLADPVALARAAAAVSAWLHNVPAGPVLLVNNAGLGAFGRFPGDDPARQLAIIDVNVRAVVDLTARLLPVLRVRGGGILNVASVVAYQPTPYAATYGASKAFLLSWSLALREELRGAGLRVTACCPGTTATGFFDAAGLDRLPGAAMGAEEVARFALRAWARDRPHAVPGLRNLVLTWAGSFLPRAAAARVAGLVLRRRAGPALP